jgi:pimeloyl-ACP methyl ester carboxylesterase
MSTIPKSRIYRGWVKEFFWFLLLILQAPIGFFYREAHWRGAGGARNGPHRRQTVIVITDIFCSPLVYRRLAGRLSRAGFDVLIISTGTVFSGLRAHAARLSEILTHRAINEGIIIGHGMGSLVALNLADAPRQRIGHLISLGTPFHGTRILMPLTFVPALRDMAVGSEYLLLNRMNALLFPSFDPFSAFQDQWIVPFNLTHFGQGRDLILDQVGHNNIVLSGENCDTIVEIISDRYPAPATALEQAHLQLDRPGHGSPAPSDTLTKGARPTGTQAQRSKKAAAQASRSRPRTKSKKRTATAATGARRKTGAKATRKRRN